MMSGKWVAPVSGALFSVVGAGHALAQIPVPPPPIIHAAPLASSIGQEPRPVQAVKLVLIQNGQTIMNQPLRIGGRGNSSLSIAEPVSDGAPRYPGVSSWQANMQQINIVITPARYGTQKNLYTINIRYSRPDGAGDAERSVNLQQTFEWAGKPIDFKVSDEFQVRLAP